MLDLAYDQIVHPQKNLTLRVLLDAVMGRLVELKYEMIQLEQSEYHYMDDVIADMELTPHDVEITGMPRDRLFSGLRGSIFMIHY